MADKFIVKTYLLERSQNMLESLSPGEIRHLLATGKLSGQTRIYAEATNSWLTLATHPDFQPRARAHAQTQRQNQAQPQRQSAIQPQTTFHFTNPIKSPILEQDMLLQLPSTDVASQLPNLLQTREWYYLVGQVPVGAFTYLEMIRLRQTKRLPMNSAVWRQGMPQWTPALMTQEFHPEAVKQVLNTRWAGLQKFFTPRKFARAAYQAKFVLHNEQQIWRAISFEIAAGGLGLIVDSTDLQVGQEFFLHKTSLGPGPEINARVQVVSRSTNGLRPGQSRLGVEFIDIRGEVQREILSFTTHPGEDRGV